MIEFCYNDDDEVYQIQEHPHVLYFCIGEEDKFMYDRNNTGSPEEFYEIPQNWMLESLND